MHNVPFCRFVASPKLMVDGLRRFAYPIPLLDGVFVFANRGVE